MAMTFEEAFKLQDRAARALKTRSGAAISEQDKVKYLTALERIAEGASVQGTADELGLNQYTLYAFVKGRKKLDLLVSA